MRCQDPSSQAPVRRVRSGSRCRCARLSSSMGRPSTRSRAVLGQQRKARRRAARRPKRAASDLRASRRVIVSLAEGKPSFGLPPATAPAPAQRLPSSKSEVGAPLPARRPHQGRVARRPQPSTARSLSIEQRAAAINVRVPRGKAGSERGRPARSRPGRRPRRREPNTASAGSGASSTGTRAGEEQRLPESPTSLPKAAGVRPAWLPLSNHLSRGRPLMGVSHFCNLSAGLRP